MVPPDVQKSWYEALFEEDCLRVKRLLKDHGELLKVGWKSDTNLEVEGSPDNHWMPKIKSPWKGRTALHVGARRGDVELVQQVLILCDMPDVTLLSSRTVEDAMKALSPERIKTNSGAQDLYKLRGRMRVRPEQDPNPTSDSAHDMDADTRDRNVPEDSIANLTPQAFLTSASDSSTSSQGALQRYRASAENHWYTRSGRINTEAVAGLSDYLVSKSELQQLLLSKDGEYDLDALAMATLQGNVDVIVLLVYALGECDSPSYVIQKSESFSHAALIDINLTHRTKLKEVTREIIDYFYIKEQEFIVACVEEYKQHKDFNFLPIEEYLFHFTWTSRFEKVFYDRHKNVFRYNLWRKILLEQSQEKIEEEKLPSEQETIYTQKKADEQGMADEQWLHNELWRFVVRLHDGQGRGPMHVSTDEGTLMHFISVLGTICVELAGKSPDGSGKFPLHRAAAIGSTSSTFSDFIDRSCIDAPGERLLGQALAVRQVSSFSLSALSDANGFRSGEYSGCNPLQAAIIHNNVEFLWLPSFIEVRQAWEMSYGYEINVFEVLSLDIMELACFVGADVEWVRNLLKLGGSREEYYANKSRAYKPSKYVQNFRFATNVEKSRYALKHWWPALHFAATSGNYATLKVFLDNSVDPFVEDTHENTALHCVMRDGMIHLGDKWETVQFKTHLLDYVSCKHLLMKDQRKVGRTCDDNFLADRQGCVNLLLQAGCDNFKTNKDQQVPYPQGRLSSSVTFLSWWYEKQAKEFAAIQNSLNNAANAISVTATLVATASFVGPLQPPRGYTQDHQMEYENAWVGAFVFCDTLSFYLAIVAILFSLIPSLPVPQQAMFDELRRTKAMVTLAVGAVFLSIVSILIAFASSSIAVVSPRITSALGANLAISTVSVGGLTIVVAFIFFVARLLGLCFPRNSWIRHFYEKTYF